MKKLLIILCLIVLVGCENNQLNIPESKNTEDVVVNTKNDIEEKEIIDNKTEDYFNYETSLQNKFNNRRGSSVVEVDNSLYLHLTDYNQVLEKYNLDDYGGTYCYSKDLDTLDLVHAGGSYGLTYLNDRLFYYLLHGFSNSGQIFEVNFDDISAQEELVAYSSVWSLLSYNSELYFLSGDIGHGKSLHKINLDQLEVITLISEPIIIDYCINDQGIYVLSLKDGVYEIMLYKHDSDDSPTVMYSSEKEIKEFFMISKNRFILIEAGSIFEKSNVAILDDFSEKELILDDISLHSMSYLDSIIYLVTSEDALSNGPYELTMFNIDTKELDVKMTDFKEIFFTEHYIIGWQYVEELVEANIMDTVFLNDLEDLFSDQ